MYIDCPSGDLNKREPEWFRKLHRVKDAPGNELFNLAEELGEGTNLVLQEASRAAEMKALFNRLWADKARSTPPFSEQNLTAGTGAPSPK